METKGKLAAAIGILGFSMLHNASSASAEPIDVNLYFQWRANGETNSRLTGVDFVKDGNRFFSMKLNSVILEKFNTTRL
jgi:hypothetical protein